MDSLDNKVSIVIPVKNEVDKVSRCIDAILNQTIKPKEIIVIDSGSTDGTLDILKSYKEITLIEIPPAEFDHGLTRNLGVKHASGEYVLLTVQDAWPASKDWIKMLLDGFTDNDVAVVCGTQAVPHHKGANPVEWHRRYSTPTIKRYQYKDGEFEKLSPGDKQRSCALDDVNAMYRRSVLAENPFPKTMYAEDMMWAKSILQKGYAVAYNPAAYVYHYHTESKEYVYKRTSVVSYLKYLHFNYFYDIPELTPKKALSMLKLIFTAKGLSFSEKINWVRYNIETHKALKSAITDFRNAHAKGEEYLHKKYAPLLDRGAQRV